MKADKQKFSLGSFLRLRIGKGDSGSIRLTAVGLGVLMITLLIVAAAFNTGTNLLYVIVSTLLSFCFVSIVYGGINVTRLDAHRRLPTEVYAGDSSEYELEVVNRKRWFGSYGIALTETLPDLGHTSAYFLSVAPGQNQTQRVRVVFPRRGLVRFDRLLVVSCFPFGFLEFRARKQLASEVLVFPKLIDVESLIRLHGPDLGEREMNSKGAGVSLFAIRDYQPGDPARSIHWKLSSKGTGIKAREYEREESKTILLILDFACPGEITAGEIEKFEKAVSVTASLAKYFVDHGHETSLWTPAGTIAKGTGPNHLHRIMRALALVEIEQFNECDSYPRSGPDVTEIWITSRTEKKDAPGTNGRMSIDPEEVVEQAASNRF